MASGNTLCRFHPAAYEPAATNFPVPGVRNNHPTLDFDPITQQTCYFTDVLPKAYSGGGLTLRVRWMAASATSGDCVWLSAIERIDAGTLDTDADSFASDQTVTTTTNGASGISVESVMTFTSGAAMDSLAAGETFRLRLERDADVGGDSMTGNAQLVSAVLEET